MFQTIFQDLFRAVDRIESGLSATDEEGRQILSEELALLRSTCDEYIEYWLRFEERVTDLCERYQLELGNPSPPLQNEDPKEDKYDTGISSKKSADLTSAASNVNQSIQEQLQSIFATSLSDIHLNQGLGDDAAADSFRAGLGYFDLLLFDQSIRQMEHVIELSPDLTIARLYLSLAYLAKGNLEKCALHLHYVSLLEKEPILLATVEATQAQMEAKKGRPADALLHFRKALELEPEYKDVHYNMAVCEWQRQNYREAAFALQRAVEANPKDWQAYQLLGRCYIRMNQLQKALVELEKAKKLNPGNVPLLLNLADIYQMIGRFPSAGILYERILDLVPDYGPALSGLGWVRLQEGKPVLSLKLFQRQLETSDSSFEPLYNLGCAELAQGNFKQAEHWLAQIQKGNPFDPYAAYALSRAYLGLGRHELALEQVTPYVESANREIRAMALAAIGRIYYEWGQERKAVRYLKLSHLLNGNTPDTCMLLAACYKKMGEQAEADKYLQLVQLLQSSNRMQAAGIRQAQTELLH